MIDCVELVLLHQSDQVWKLHCDYAIRLEKNFHALHKVVDIRNLSQDIIPNEKVRLFAVQGQSLGGIFAKKVSNCRDAFFNCSLGNPR